MALQKPGDYITCKCGRCSDVTGHVVMLVLDGEIAKVECKACGSVHKYRETKTAKPRAKEPAVRRVRAGQSREQAIEVGSPSSRIASLSGTEKSRSSGRSASRISSKAKLESAWQEAMVRHSADTPIPYAMAGSYAVRDFLEHSVFGRGEVIAVVPPDKMDVLFEDGVKTLRCKV